MLGSLLGSWPSSYHHTSMTRSRYQVLFLFSFVDLFFLGTSWKFSTGLSVPACPFRGGFLATGVEDREQLHLARRASNVCCGGDSLDRAVFIGNNTSACWALGGAFSCFVSKAATLSHAQGPLTECVAVKSDSWPRPSASLLPDRVGAGCRLHPPCTGSASTHPSGSPAVTSGSPVQGLGPHCLL